MSDDTTKFMNIHRIRAVVIHHSGGPRSQSFESIRDYHKRERHYTDIGYHYVIIEDGTLRYGRPVPAMGAHALGRNADTLGICLVGNNTERGQEWLPAQLETLRRLLEALRLVLPPFEVIRHGDAYREHKTECPGVTRKALDEMLRS